MRASGEAPARRRSNRLAPLALALLLAGCTGQPWDLGTAGPSDGPGRPGATTAPAAPVGSGGVAGALGRIAVLDADGTLTTFEADGGGDPVVLDGSDPDETFVRQPTWSPDGRIAWVRIGDGGTSATLHTTDADGGNETETPIAAAPFYLSWDPTSSRIVYLGGSANADIELGLIDVAAGTAAEPLDDGSPFYVSWNPSGTQLLIHVGLDRLDRLMLDGTATSVGDAPGMFSAPVWTADGRTFVYAAQAPDGQRLVARDRDSRHGRTLTRFDGTIAFVVSPDGRRIAFQVVDGSSIVVPLSVIDRRTGSVERLTGNYSPAFFWSPSGAKLLALQPELEDERIWFRWAVWGEDGSTFTTERFSPSLEFSRDYLRFFEQYAQSMRLWSPDEEAFVYAGESESGASGVWIQPATEGAPPTLVADGVFATWSP